MLVLRGCHAFGLRKGNQSIMRCVNVSVSWSDSQSVRQSVISQLVCTDRSCNHHHHPCAVQLRLDAPEDLVQLVSAGSQVMDHLFH